MLITPTGLAYDEHQAARRRLRRRRRQRAAGKQRKPSSEWRFHLAAYQARPDMGAVVHTHSTPCDRARLRAAEPIPAFHYMVAVAGGKDIPVVPYATFGTDELADHVAGGLTERNACLMANHGVIALGDDACCGSRARGRGRGVGRAVRRRCSRSERPTILSDDEMTLMVEKFRTYGRQAAP